MIGAAPVGLRLQPSLNWRLWVCALQSLLEFSVKGRLRHLRSRARLNFKLKKHILIHEYVYMHTNISA